MTQVRRDHRASLETLALLELLDSQVQLDTKASLDQQVLVGSLGPSEEGLDLEDLEVRLDTLDTWVSVDTPAVQVTSYS